MTLILLNCIYIFKLYFFISYANIDYEITSVIRQKGESQNGCFKKTKHAKFAEKRMIRIGGKKCSFFGKFGVLSFLETPVSRIALLPYYRQLTL